MLDLPALPIAFALTLWDAAPIYLSIGLAVVIVARAALRGQSFHMLWDMREKVSPEGIAYLLVFQPILAPIMIPVIFGHVLVARTAALLGNDPPANPGQALKARGSELFWTLLLGSLVAAAIKLSGPTLPDHLAIQILLATAIGAALGSKPAAVAIPAVAVAVHLGGVVPAAACLLATLFWPAAHRLRQSAPAAERSS